MVGGKREEIGREHKKCNTCSVHGPTPQDRCNHSALQIQTKTKLKIKNKLIFFLKRLPDLRKKEASNAHLGSESSQCYCIGKPKWDTSHRWLIWSPGSRVRRTATLLGCNTRRHFRWFGVDVDPVSVKQWRQKLRSAEKILLITWFQWFFCHFLLFNISLSLKIICMSLF